ncbi:MAG TPA: bifunctional diaminohydroxyphosphoribosylaminopyrimidine deaminase/5-amino-6-(5-phosphoribosylamino)uracil reductase RibD [Glaciihabitans sp.]|jgi:diaminohydroxyphosphoribosylaminopyrimidine deaminase/5-amino-6-(5-phosphoribosylamino)uracil reductase|nr:bifunctional diaminohydroxyphosphoribosylaminopyrimidine deaminase/5-amino-6-(5-phosphoribosylamino)uracil reductase RibD [Glaciihabitans sp.]
MTLTSTDIESAMRRSLDLAARGPALGINPQVGCVLLDSAGTIVAEGWHRGVGTPHAEVDALSKIRDRSGGPTSALAGSTAGYAAGLTAVVTLEPCNHTGHTGPCTEALIEAGVDAVYYAVADPSPLASGGAERLRNSGIPTSHGVLTTEVSEFLRPWLLSVERSRPFVTVKWASTLDGRAAAADGSSQWITGTASRQRVHEQREANDAIVVGTGTVLADDPSLTARGDAGELMEHQPIPVVIGERAIAATAKLHQHPQPVIETRSRDLPAILGDLFARGIRRIYVEGGPTLISAFVAADLVDEYTIYLAPSLLGGDRVAIGDIGVPSIGGAKQLTITGIEQLGNDLLIHARPLATALPLATGPKE